MTGPVLFDEPFTIAGIPDSPCPECGEPAQPLVNRFERFPSVALSAPGFTEVYGGRSEHLGWLLSCGHFIPSAEWEFHLDYDRRGRRDEMGGWAATVKWLRRVPVTAEILGGCAPIPCPPMESLTLTALALVCLRCGEEYPLDVADNVCPPCRADKRRYEPALIGPEVRCYECHREFATNLLARLHVCHG